MYRRAQVSRSFKTSVSLRFYSLYLALGKATSPLHTVQDLWEGRHTAEAAELCWGCYLHIFACHWEDIIGGASDNKGTRYCFRVRLHCGVAAGHHLHLGSPAMALHTLPPPLLSPPLPSPQNSQLLFMFNLFRVACGFRCFLSFLYLSLAALASSPLSLNPFLPPLSFNTQLLLCVTLNIPSCLFLCFLSFLYLILITNGLLFFFYCTLFLLYYFSYCYCVYCFLD